MIITVIVPVYNQSPDLLYRTINSITNQTYKNIEIIVVNDGSKINYVLDKKIKVLNNKKNYGISYSLNEGIKKSTGQYICWSSSDDGFYPEKIDKQINFMLKNNLELSSHDYNIEYLNNNVFSKNGIEKSILNLNTNNYFDKIKKECFINGSTVMIKKNVFNKIGNFNLSLKYCQDWEFWIRFFYNNLKYDHIHEILGFRLEHKNNLSNNIILNNINEVSQKQKEVIYLKNKYEK